jgi:hypothetical protein
MNNNIGHNITAGVVGALTVVLIGIVIFAIHSPIDVAPVYMINTTQVTDSIQLHQLDSLRCEHLEVLKDLEDKGLLLSPSDYTSHITSFYNGLIAFLIGIFVLFTVGGVLTLRFTSKREIEEIKQEVNNGTRKHIITQLQSMINDSVSFQETTLNALTGRFEDKIITQEQLKDVEKAIDKIEDNLKKIQESIDMLYEYYNDIEEIKAANENISAE